MKIRYCNTHSDRETRWLSTTVVTIESIVSVPRADDASYLSNVRKVSRRQSLVFYVFLLGRRDHTVCSVQAVANAIFLACETRFP